MENVHTQHIETIILLSQIHIHTEGNNYSHSVDITSQLWPKQKGIVPSDILATM